MEFPSCVILHAAIEDDLGLGEGLKLVRVEGVSGLLRVHGSQPGLLALGWPDPELGEGGVFLGKLRLGVAVDLAGGG